MEAGTFAVALKKGIDMEFQTRSFYQRMAARITNRKAGRMASAMMRDEEGHETKLKGRLLALTGERYEPNPSAPPHPKYALAEAAVYDQAVAREIVSVGIFLETESIKHYTALRESAAEKEDAKLFSSLVKLEEGHRRKLQREYHRIEHASSFLRY